MQTKNERALELFLGGYNCAQSVLASFSEGYGLEAEKALKISGCMGGGCRHGDICGAVMGAVMVVGLKYGRGFGEDAEAKQICDAAFWQYMEEFKKTHGSIVCRELLGYDVSTEEGMAKHKLIPRAESPCTDFVKDTVDILEEIGF